MNLALKLITDSLDAIMELEPQELERIMKEGIFPVMCDISNLEFGFLYFFQHATALYETHKNAQRFLYEMVGKRPNTIKSVFDFLIKILNTQADELDPTQKYAAIHIIGIFVLASEEVKAHKTLVEDIFVKYVLPLFRSPHAFLRGESYFLVRCWCKAKVQFKEHLFTQIIENMMHCIGNDIDTSVQVMANMALNYLLLYQLGPNRLSEGGTTQVQMDLIKANHDAVRPHLGVLLKKLVNLTRETSDYYMLHSISTLTDKYSKEAPQVIFHLVSDLTQLFFEFIDKEITEGLNPRSDQLHPDYIYYCGEPNPFEMSLPVLDVILSVKPKVPETKEFMCLMEQFLDRLIEKFSTRLDQARHFEYQIRQLIGHFRTTETFSSRVEQLRVIYDDVVKS